MITVTIIVNSRVLRTVFTDENDTVTANVDNKAMQSTFTSRMTKI